MTHSAACLLIFAKAPQPSRVKTRLASRLGAERAAQVHGELVQHSLATLSNGAAWATQLWCAPDTAHPFFQACRQHHRLSLHCQQGTDLGQRMHHALATALRHNSAALLIGSDCPYLTRTYVEEALDALHQGNDGVLVPARDGGYVLIGLRRPQSALFKDVPWGGPAVLASTRERFRRARLRWRELPPLEDIDDAQDLERLLNQGAGPTADPSLQKLARRLRPLLD
ncbi:MAG: TIGR04282 family arsenosugar biosynthesis glycosyltransferase [Gammaproteobacteria bacterium]